MCDDDDVDDDGDEWPKGIHSALSCSERIENLQMTRTVNDKNLARYYSLEENEICPVRRMKMLVLSSARIDGNQLMARLRLGRALGVRLCPNNATWVAHTTPGLRSATVAVASFHQELFRVQDI